MVKPSSESTVSSKDGVRVTISGMPLRIVQTARQEDGQRWRATYDVFSGDSVIGELRADYTYQRGSYRRAWYGRTPDGGRQVGGTWDASGTRGYVLEAIVKASQ